MVCASKGNGFFFIVQENKGFFYPFPTFFLGLPKICFISFKADFIVACLLIAPFLANV